VGGSEVTFGTDQIRALNMVARSRPNSALYVTGKAGTGKTTVENAIKSKTSCVVLAPTGLAALGAGGSTMHKFFGFATGPAPRDRVSNQTRDVIYRADKILVDEVSMVRADLMDSMNTALQRAMGSEQAFGGKDVVFFGDHWQLEPVVSDEDVAVIESRYVSPWFFDANVFTKDTLFGQPVTLETIELREVFRQRNEEFVNALNLIREGDPVGIAQINDMATVADARRGAVRLTFTRKRADAVNDRMLDRLTTDEKVFTAQVQGDIKSGEYPVPAELRLRIGAQVMVAKNFTSEAGQVMNGQVGVVEDWSEDGYPIVFLQDERLVTIRDETWGKASYSYNRDKDEIDSTSSGEFTQVPLKLAWAITTHKAQGMTLDNAHLELDGEAFAHGQLYVALSRIRTPEGLTLGRKLSRKDLKVSSRVRDWHQERFPRQIHNPLMAVPA
jgi:ATP-dependent exoDNAse (exonuclease V) alpha subunit